MRRLSAALSLVPVALVAACSGDALPGGDDGPPDGIAADLAAAVEQTSADVAELGAEEAAAASPLLDLEFAGAEPDEVAQDFVDVVAGMAGIRPTVEGALDGDAVSLTWSWP